MGKKAIRWWQKKSNLAVAVFLLAAGNFLIADHRELVIQWLPWALILGCVFVHLFMHGKHEYDHDDRSGKKP